MDQDVKAEYEVSEALTEEMNVASHYRVGVERAIRIAIVEGAKMLGSAKRDEENIWKKIMAECGISEWGDGWVFDFKRRVIRRMTEEEVARRGVLD